MLTPRMLTLAIDCATEACSVALFDGEERIAADYRILGRGHAEQLIPMIAELPERGRADRIAVATGPGSFTGLRVGIAAARALAFAWGAELVGYPTLALIAAMARAQLGQHAVTVAMTGGHGEWFVESFGSDGLQSRAFAALTPGEAVVAAEERVAGNQAEALVALRGTGQALPLWPDAGAMMLLPQAAWLTSDVRPIYGRAPDARLPVIPI